MPTTTKKTNLNVKVDAELKQAADLAFKEMGMNTSVAVNMFLKRVVTDGAFPFTPRYDKATETAITNVREHKNLQSFDSVNALFQDLNDEG
ncbi:type II toxin-antitoxin system RelB/DinJ family antitoxin [Loigolactobacillus zhaoyuanensis]|uniref:Type II toxin-antitoxin system RelB/DinJ family antitoxin n=1 Tax=Loigolactobacillus zhaoyuanensis TaxID=2486017 RepID=A0ABW8U973_9LACO|nr:type II toxin-antitoxin system RelB/DinJ family antitoxin [Loigolactobacillus zhaoyuanensis]